MNTPASPQPERLTTSFLPVHKRAFGTATGIAAALAIFVVTAIAIVRGPQHGFTLALLAEYFAGYSVSWGGAVIGAAWAAFTGFVMGWFLAFGRNFVVATILVVIRARADLSATRTFLDDL